MSFDAVARVGEAWIRIDEAVADTLMRSSVIVEVAIDVDGMPQTAIADEPEVMQAFGLK